MPITKNIADVTDQDRPFAFSRINGDGTVTLFYFGESPPKLLDQTAASEEAQNEMTKYFADASVAKKFVKLSALAGMSPLQVQAWVAANVTTLAQAQDAISTLAIAVSILSRKL